MSETRQSQISGLINQLNQVWVEIDNEMTELKKSHKVEVQTLEKKIDELQFENDTLNSKFQKINQQMEETLTKLKDLETEDKRDLDALKLLDIYLVLVGEVFNSGSHVRILFILHGEKEIYTLDELTKASGLRGLEVRQAVFDLRNAGLVEYNDDNQEVKLLSRFM